MGCDICRLLFAISARLGAVKSHFCLTLVLQPAGSELGVTQELLLPSRSSCLLCPTAQEGRGEAANAISHLTLVLWQGMDRLALAQLCAGHSGVK